MSLAVANPAGTPYQPFECYVCQQRFTRHENLKRHAARHAAEHIYHCDFCDVTFSRRDLRNRHVKRKHPDHERRRYHAVEHGYADEGATNSSISRLVSFNEQSWNVLDHENVEAELNAWPAYQSSQRKPHDLQSTQPPISREQRSNSSPSAVSADHSSPAMSIPEGLSPSDLPYLHENWSPSASQTAHGYRLYFKHVSLFVPFLHRPTFDATATPPHLGLSMLCLAYQHGEDPDDATRKGSGAELSLRCFHRARTLAAMEEEATNGAAACISLVQAYWLLEICAMFYFCDKKSSNVGLRIHSRMIALARSGGLTTALRTDSPVTEDLEGLWRSFAEVESHKRTMLAIHQLDSMWYQFLSIPRLLSHLEIKHSLPCSEAAWNATSAASWAHLQLTSATSSTSSTTLTEAIRNFLSQDQCDMSALPPFDPLGAISIAHFLLSSAREISGWSTLTGQISLERFLPLRSSLLALEPYLRPSSISGEATWEMAMIELQMWSPSHTCGIVEGSVDTMLQKWTELAKDEFIEEGLEAGLLQGHLDWFLRYLDETDDVDGEPPWIALYAYKAFSIAWQLVRRGVEGAMAVVHVADGDVSAAVVWARKVFLQERWKGDRRDNHEMSGYAE